MEKHKRKEKEKRGRCNGSFWRYISNPLVSNRIRIGRRITEKVYSTKTELLIYVLKTKIEIARPKRFTKVAASATNYERTQGTTFGAALFTE